VQAARCLATRAFAGSFRDCLLNTNNLAAMRDTPSRNVERAAAHLSKQSRRLQVARAFLGRSMGSTAPPKVSRTDFFGGETQNPSFDRISSPYESNRWAGNVTNLIGATDAEREGRPSLRRAGDAGPHSSSRRHFMRRVPGLLKIVLARNQPDLNSLHPAFGMGGPAWSPQIRSSHEAYRV